MKDKFNQFVDNVNGQFVEVSYKKALYQCMDLAYLWVFCLGLPKATIQHLYAYQVYTNPTDLTKKHFDLIPNTPNAIPKDGDLVVLKGGTAGHIVIALSGGTTSSFKCFEQNNPLGTNAHIQSRSYKNVLGWLSPKKAGLKFTQKEMDAMRKQRDDNWNLYKEEKKKLKGVVDGKYIKKEDCDRIKREKIKRLKEDFIKKNTEDHKALVKVCNSCLKAKEKEFKIKEKFLILENSKLRNGQKKEIDNALKKAKKDWKVVELQDEVKECKKFRKTTAYKIAEIITKALEALKIIKKEVENGSTRISSKHKRTSK